MFFFNIFFFFFFFYTRQILFVAREVPRVFVRFDLKRMDSYSFRCTYLKKYKLCRTGRDKRTCQYKHSQCFECMFFAGHLKNKNKWTPSTRKQHLQSFPKTHDSTFVDTQPRTWISTPTGPAVQLPPSLYYIINPMNDAKGTAERLIDFAESACCDGNGHH